jgi:hypothetical protein
MSCHGAEYATVQTDAHVFHYLTIGCGAAPLLTHRHAVEESRIGRRGVSPKTCFHAQVKGEPVFIAGDR